MKRLALLALLLAPSVEAAIAFRSVGTVGTSSATGTVTLGVPAGVLSTDVVVAGITTGDTAANVSAPTGWTRALGTDDLGGGETLVVFWALGNVASYTFTASLQADTITGIAAAYSGVDNVTPMDVTAVGQANAASGTVTAPSISTVTANTQIVFFGAPYDNGAGNIGTWTTVFGTIRGSGGIRGGLADSTDIAVADAAQAGTGASGAKTETYSIAFPNVGILAALRPAAGAVATPLRTLLGVGQ